MDIKFIEVMTEEDGEKGWNLFNANEIRRVLMFDKEIRYYTGHIINGQYFTERFETEIECRYKYAEVKRILTQE